MLNPLHDIIFLSCSFCILYRNNNITNKSIFFKERYFYVKIDTLKKSLNSDGKHLFLIFSKISPCTVLSTIINIKYYPELCNILMEWNILANSVIWLVNQAGDMSPYKMASHHIFIFLLILKNLLFNFKTRFIW
jgi:hypothetical protein